MQFAERVLNGMTTKKESPKVWKKIFALLPRKQKGEFFLVLAILAVSAVLSQLTPLTIGYLTDHVLAAQSATFQSVLPILLVILLVNVVNEVIKVIRRLIVEDAATQAEKNARQRAALSLLMAPLSYFRNHMTGNIHGRLNRSLEGTVKLIKLLFMDFAPAVFTGVAAIVTIFWQLPFTVACLVILVIPVGTFIVFRQISTQKGIRVELMDTKADMDGTMVELLGGIETIRALDSAHTESARIEAQSEQLRRKEMRHHKAMAFYDCLKFVNEAFFSVLVIGLSVLLASQQVITIGTVLTAYLCFTQLTGPLRELHRILDEFSECVVLADDYFQLLELPLDFSYEETPEGGNTRLAGNDIRLCGVRFSYPEKPDQPILKDIDLCIDAGKFIGVAGPSGCGKSTLIKVIDKLERADGAVTLGGASLAALSRRVLAENVALVPQTPFLIADTVYHNICYGLSGDIPLADVQEAARKANIAADIEKLPGRYDFVLSEGGTNLSGGQRQRIALARIFLRKPKILILDEATSALDNTSEKLIQREIERMKEECGTTVISIAHRLSTLQNCDEILVMDGGRIVQRGTFRELENTPGIFQDMARGILK
ncbi:ABC transporter, ATP-binding protein [Subdoligranulum variabile DSM 15176]|uniref:ABC transporter, ATP-binding protein n=2 Tax=Subdoligranulum variabile TaxID=214851 RepID=D1PN02_9FIRM|nr:ABC transporter, ATP-binding protein [Subdoligranulum variabile DSM 15176]